MDGFLSNFFEVPFEYQEVIFMMVKGDQEGLQQSKLYQEQEDIFNYYLACIVEFSKEFDPTETLLDVANDPERRDIIHAAPDEPVPLSYVLDDLWPKLGFLPVDPNNEGFALVAEFMLNELILKYSDSLDKLNLKHLKELFVGGDEDDLEGMDEEEYNQLRAEMEAEQRAAAMAGENDDDYS